MIVIYNLSEIKSLPCGDVAKKYGISLKEKGNRLWGKLRNGEKTESFSINLQKNLWYDFGSGKGGSVIDLVAEIEGITPNEAINRLAEDYGFKSEKTNGWRPLTDRQYKEIGIQPERATMNFGFDLNKHTEEQLDRWSKKYGMSVQELSDKYPKVYNKMINKIVMDNINVLKDTYSARLNIYHDSTTNSETKSFLRNFAMDDAEELNRKIDLLQRAIKPSYEGQKINFSYLKVDVEKDFKEKQSNIIKALSEDEKIRNHIVKVYKKLFNYNQVDYFTVEQAKALQQINKAIVNGENKYIPIDGIKRTYEKLGKNLEHLEKEYKNLITEGSSYLNKSSPEYREWNSKTKLAEKNLGKVKELFTKCNTVIEGIREANLTTKKDLLKNKTLDISTNKEIDLSY